MTVFRSGFAAVVGRPNVGKSTLVNAMVGTKVTITSPRPNTTRAQVRGVLNRPDAQVVFVDTPGLHKPRTALGERMNESATCLAGRRRRGGGDGRGHGGGGPGRHDGADPVGRAGAVHGPGGHPAEAGTATATGWAIPPCWWW